MDNLLLIFLLLFVQNKFAVNEDVLRGDPIPTKPIWKSKGNKYAMVFLDFHTKFDKTGECSGFDTRAVELLWGLQWIRDITNNSTENKLGLVVYDTCRSEIVTAQVISKQWFPGQCSHDNNTQITAVISYTTTNVRRTIDAFLEPFQVPHIRVMRDRFLSQNSPPHLDIDTLSMWKLQSIVTLIQTLDWYNVALVSMETEEAQGEVTLFKKMLTKAKICFRSTDLSTFKLNKLDPGIVVVFSTGGSNLSDVLNAARVHPNCIFLINGNFQMKDLNKSTPDNIIFVSEEIQTPKQIQDYLQKNNANEEFGTSLGNDSHHLLTTRNMSDNIWGRDMVGLLSAYVNAERQVYAEHFCSMNTSMCKKIKFLALSLHQQNFGDPLNVFRVESNVFLNEEVQTRLLYRTTEKSTEMIANVFQGVITVMNKTAWEQLSSLAIPHDQYSCYWNESFENDVSKIVVQNGDLFIGGVFPITKGPTCQVLNWEGIILAEAFMYAIHVINRQNGILRNVRLGGFVVDSCGVQNDEDVFWKVKKECRKFPVVCNKGFDSMLKSPALVHFHEENDQSNEYYKTPAIHIYPSSVQLNNAHFRTYLPQIITLLKALNWTYVDVIYSERLYEMAKIRKEITMLPKNNICLASQVVLKLRDAETRKLAKRILSDVSKPKIVLLVTLARDTEWLLDIASNMSDVNLVILPHGLSAKSVIPKGSVTLKPQNADNKNAFSRILSGYDVSYSVWNPFLFEYLEEKFQCHHDLDNNIIFPNTCPYRLLLKNSEISESSSRVMKAVFTQVKAINFIYQKNCPEKNGTCKNFVNSDIKAMVEDILMNHIPYKTKSSKAVFKFDSSRNGLEDLDILNGRNGHLEKVGSFDKNGSMEVDYQNVYTYNNKSEPYIANHTCSSGCHKCGTCFNANHLKTSTVIYKEGDIIIGAVFPLSNIGKQNHTCGDTRHESWLYLTAFNFALHTFYARYPGLSKNMTFGSVVFDSCSDSTFLLKNIIDFETCSGQHSNVDVSSTFTSQEANGYIVIDNNAISGLSIPSVLDRFGKKSFVIKAGSIPGHQMNKKGIEESIRVTAEIASHYGMKKVVLLIDSEFFNTGLETFLKNKNICILNVINTTENIDTSFISQMANIYNVIALGKYSKLENYFKVIGNFTEQLMIVNLLGPLPLLDVSIPAGAIVVGQDGLINFDFVDYVLDLLVADNSSSDSSHQGVINLKKLLHLTNTSVADVVTSSHVILSVDAMLHGLEQGSKDCLLQGCLRQDSAIWQGLGVNFVYQKELTAHLNNKNVVVTDTIGLWQAEQNKLNQIGRWSKGKLSHWITLSKQLKPKSVFNLTSPFCQDTLALPFHDEEVVFSNSYISTNDKCQLNLALWTVGVMIFSASGSAMTLFILCFIIYKACIGVVVKKHVGLTILTLVSIVSLYLAVLPFIFTPCEPICLARIIVPSLAYVFLFATMLSKLMSIKAHNSVGLGGNVSVCNHLLCTFFICAVQVSTTLMHSLYSPSSLTTLEGMYMCNLGIADYLLHSSYNLFILLLCGLYAIALWRDNGEAKLILIASWLTVGVWVLWIIMGLLGPRAYLETIICGGILLTASVVVIFVFIPRLYYILKVKISQEIAGDDTNASMTSEKIDIEFTFERANSLPGTFDTVKSYKRRCKSKSISTIMFETVGDRQTTTHSLQETLKEIEDMKL